MLITAIIFTGIGVFATIGYQADEIGYGTGTVKDAIDDLYTTANTTVTGLESQITNLQNQVNNPDCVSGTYTWTQDDVDNGGKVFTNFKPKFLVVREHVNLHYYNADENNNVLKRYSTSNNTATITDYNLTETNVKIDTNFRMTWGTNRIGTTIYYMACK